MTLTDSNTQPQQHPQFSAIAEHNLILTSVSRSFGGLKAVDGVSIDFKPAQVNALIGANGAGKTTLFNLICGTLKPDSGSISFRGKEISRLAPWSIARVGVGRLFQEVRVFGKLTALENVMVAFPKQAGENPLTSIFARLKVNSQLKRLTTEAMQLMDQVGLAEYARNQAGQLSYGQQKLLAFARLLALKADVLLLDEPTAGINPEVVEQIESLITEQAEGGKTVVIIEHNTQVVTRLADWVYLLHEGRLYTEGSADRVLDDPTVAALYSAER